MTQPTPPMSGDAARSHGCAGLKADDCRYCMRQGLPILPVRYAVCQAEHTDIQALPENREAELYPVNKDGERVPIRLDTVVVEDGNLQSGRPKVNKYILRTLRMGFLYLYDEGNSEWYAYSITDTSEFLQFSIAETDELNRPPKPFACYEASHRASSKLITLPKALSTKKAWVLYVEAPLSRGFLRDVASTEDWRTRHMQCFDVEAWLDTGNADYAFSADEIGNLVPEYTSARSQLSTHRFSSDDHETSLGDISGAIQSRVENSAALAGKTGQGVMLAIKDEVAIIDELNDYRQRPIEKMREFQGENNNHRQSQWLASLNQLKTALNEAAAAEISQIDSELSERIDAYVPSLRQETQSYLKDMNERVSEASEDLRGGYREYVANQIDDEGYYKGANGYQEYHLLLHERNRKIRSVNESLARTLDEFDHYYDVDKKNDAESLLAPYQQAIEELTPRHDADYSQWVMYGLAPALERYDSSNMTYGLQVTEIVSEALFAGKLSENSKWLWSHLMDNIDGPDSFILDAYFSHHKETKDKYLAEVATLENESSFFGQTQLKDWYELLSGLRKVSSHGWQQPDFEAFRKKIDQLSSTVTSASASLLSEQATEQLHAGQSPAPDTRPLLRYARLLQINNLGMSADGTYEQQASHVVELDVDMGTYSHSLRYLANPDGSPILSGEGAYQYADQTDNSYRVGGNTPEVDIRDETRTRVLWQVKETELRHFASYVEGDIRAGGSPKTLRLVDQFNMMQRQRSLHGRLWGEKNVFRHLDVVFSIYSFFETAKVVADAPRSMENWWKLLGSIASLSQVVFDTIVNYQVRRGLASSGGSAIQRTAAALATKEIASHIGLVSAAIGIIDGFRTLGEAGTLHRRGALSSQVVGKASLGGISIAGGILAVACGSLVLVPLLLCAITLVVAYKLIQLVTLNIRTWLRRSLYGIEQENYRFAPFNSSEEEQTSLKMVFSGIVFDMDVVRFGDTFVGSVLESNEGAYGLTPELKEQVDGYLNSTKATITLKVPADFLGDVEVRLWEVSNSKDVDYLGGVGFSEGEAIPIPEANRNAVDTVSIEVDDVADNLPNNLEVRLDENYRMLSWMVNVGGESNSVYSIVTAMSAGSSVSNSETYTTTLR